MKDLIEYRLIATAINDYLELLSSYIAQNNELQVRGPNVLIRGSSSAKDFSDGQHPTNSKAHTHVCLS